MTNEEIETVSEGIVDFVVTSMATRPYNDDDKLDAEDKTGDIKTVVCITFANGRMLVCVDPILL